MLVVEQGKPRVDETRTLGRAGGHGLGCERRVATATGWAAAHLHWFSPRGTATAPVLCSVIVFPMLSPVGCCCCRCRHPTCHCCGDPPLTVAVAAAAPPSPFSSSVLQPQRPMECTGNNSVINKNIVMCESHVIKWSFGRHLGYSKLLSRWVEESTESM